jgi:hypothetical protein
MRMQFRKLGSALVVLLLVPIFLDSTVGHQPVVAQVKIKRDKELFLRGANVIGEGHYAGGRLALQILINTYPDESRLVEQAKILIFYSLAREAGEKDKEAQGTLEQIQHYLDSQSKPRTAK